MRPGARRSCARPFGRVGRAPRRRQSSLQGRDDRAPSWRPPRHRDPVFGRGNLARHRRRRPKSAAAARRGVLRRQQRRDLARRQDCGAGAPRTRLRSGKARRAPAASAHRDCGRLRGTRRFHARSRRQSPPPAPSARSRPISSPASRSCIGACSTARRKARSRSISLWDRAIETGRIKALVHDGEWFHVGTKAGLAATEARLDTRRIER